ncbi:MAG: hypothetical protein Kow0068_13960 [Marinilabiliales bacterium]
MISNKLYKFIALINLIILILIFLNFNKTKYKRNIILTKNNNFVTMIEDNMLSEHIIFFDKWCDDYKLPKDNYIEFIGSDAIYLYEDANNNYIYLIFENYNKTKNDFINPIIKVDKDNLVIITCFSNQLNKLLDIYQIDYNKLDTLVYYEKKEIYLQ